MSTETQKVDVLAVMSNVVIDTARSDFFYDDMDNARAAVAELIEATKLLIKAQSYQVTSRRHDAIKRAKEAIARIGGDT